VRSYSEYGKLSGRSVDDMIAGARVDVAPFKRDPMDFVLWKPSDAETPGWDSPWGRGRPGWHIECSAMSHELLGPAFDIHGGGIDLQFPHHENEIAQSRCAHPEDGFAKVWMHNEMLQVEGKKMSKSLGNFFTVRDLLDQGVPGEVIRFVLLGTHYSKPMDWTAEKARQAETVLRKIAEFLGEDTLSNGWIDTRYAKAPQEVVNALANDLNTSSALTLLATYLKNRQEVQLVGTLRLLGFYPSSLTRALAPFSFHAGDNGFASGYSLTTHGTEDSVYGSMLIELGNRLSELRAQALKTKDFSSVDALKSALVSAGVEVRMEKQGVSLVPGVGFDPSKLESLE
jgi:cysteinyl-tRNA synthetase